MKQIPLLQGKALLIELPEGATNPEIHSRSLTFDTQEVDEWGYDYQSVKLPEGNWRIIGMLSEVTEEQAAGLVKKHQWSDGFFIYHNYNGKNTFNTFTALESIESAIEAAGYTFSNPFIHHPDDIEGDGSEWGQAQSRVLDRSRCLLLGGSN